MFVNSVLKLLSLGCRQISGAEVEAAVAESIKANEQKLKDERRVVCACVA